MRRDKRTDTTYSPRIFQLKCQDMKRVQDLGFHEFMYAITLTEKLDLYLYQILSFLLQHSLYLSDM
jgi:hypothetical protein